MEARADRLRRLVTADPPHVGVLLENTPEFVFLLGGAALSGHVIVGLNLTRRGEELARDIRHTDCAVVLTDPAHADAPRRARPRRRRTSDIAVRPRASASGAPLESGIHGRPPTISCSCSSPRARAGHRRPCA